jgi:hypothetical protein
VAERNMPDVPPDEVMVVDLSEPVTPENIGELTAKVEYLVFVLARRSAKAALEITMGVAGNIVASLPQCEHPEHDRVQYAHELLDACIERGRITLAEAQRAYEAATTNDRALEIIDQLRRREPGRTKES